MSRYVRTSCLKAISSSLACLPLLLAAAAAAQQSREPPKLPEGDTGLAAMHPGDVGLAQHEQVVFVENFNDSLAAIKARWDSVAGEESL